MLMVSYSNGLSSFRDLSNITALAGVIHGDIKPQNVLVFMDSTGKTTFRVTDFGYSTLAAGDAQTMQLTLRFGHEADDFADVGDDAGKH